MKKKTHQILSLLVGTMFLASCADLDPIPTDRYSERLIWQSKENAQLYLNGFYTYLNTFSIFGSGQFGSSLTDGLTDQLKYASYTAGAGDANLYATEPERISPDQNLFNIWEDTYTRIRRVNQFLESMEEFSPFTEEEKLSFRAQIRFFRAYLYFQLMKRHAQVILLDHTTSERNNPLSSEADCWAFIKTDLDFAIEHLPVTRPSGESGLLTKGAALAFMSRAMLYAKNYPAAQSAAQQCVDLRDNGGALVYDLAPQYSGAFQSYYRGNREAVLEFNYAGPDPSHRFDRDFVPGGDYSRAGLARLGAQAVPTQEMVESYELADGSGKPDWSPWHGTTTETPPYALLEPRFHASVLYNGAQWKGRTIEAYLDGIDGWLEYGTDIRSDGKSTTGYFLRKNLDENNTTNFNILSTQTLVEIRLAEVYLNLAEAAVENGDITAANNALTKVRGRVSLPFSGSSGDNLRAAIRQERKVELAFEGHHYWDLRRWERATQELNNVRFHGLKITRSGNTFTYEYQEVDNADRRFLSRMQRSFPLPTRELANNLAVEQFIEWR